MVELVYGGSGSGKSEFAEGRACVLASEAGNVKKYYLATMIPYGDEGAVRVQRHRELRAGKGFFTLEKPVDPGEVVLEEEGVVLVECIGNLTANHMYRADLSDRAVQMVDKATVVEQVVAGVEKLVCNSKVLHAVIVTNNVFEDGFEYDESTRAYMKALGEINLRLAKLAHRVTEVVCGVPVVLKPQEEK